MRPAYPAKPQNAVARTFPRQVARPARLSNTGQDHVIAVGMTRRREGHDGTLPQLGSSGKGTATRRPTAGPDGLPLTSGTKLRPHTCHAHSPP